MSLISPKIIDAMWRMIPGPVRRVLRSQGGRRLIRFAPAAVLALCATQLTYFVLQLANVTAGIAGATGWFAGAAVSYLVSRWAWERKGRPHLLKETLPFVSISICVGVVLTLTSKLATEQAHDLGFHGFDKVLFAQGLYLSANCATFVNGPMQTIVILPDFSLSLRYINSTADSFTGLRVRLKMAAG